MISPYIFKIIELFGMSKTSYFIPVILLDCSFVNIFVIYDYLSLSEIRDKEN